MSHHLFLSSLHYSLIFVIITIIDMSQQTDGASSSSSLISGPTSFCYYEEGLDRYLYVVEQYGNRVRQIDLTSNISATTIFAGNVNGNGGFSGDSGAATSANLYWPRDCDVGLYQNSRVMLIADYYNNRVREVYDDHNIWKIRTVAGTGTTSHSDGVAVNSGVGYPTSAIYDQEGNIYIMDYYNSVIRKVTRDQSGNNINTDLITTYAGTVGTIQW